MRFAAAVLLFRYLEDEPVEVVREVARRGVVAVGKDDDTEIPVRPNQFVDFLTGRTSARFVSDRASIDQRVRTLHSDRDFDGRFRIRDFFCYLDTWKPVLRRLIKDSDVVVLDARRFTAKNTGVEYEIRELLTAVPPSHAVIVVGNTTYMRLLQQVLQDAWVGLSEYSPHRSLESPEVLLHKVMANDNAEMVSIFDQACETAMSGQKGQGASTP